MSAPTILPSTPQVSLMETLFDRVPPALNEKLELRAQVLAADAIWQPTRVAGLNICILENLRGEHARMTALVRLDSNCIGASIPATELELLVQHGIIADDDSEYLHPYYLRQPKDGLGRHQYFTLHPGSGTKPTDDPQLEFYLATGQLAATDTERRCINLADSSLWLPGPAEHTEVMPLHMHNGSNSMLVRWLDAVTFRPRLDPLGEEVLVIEGTLSDELGTYPAGSWIRNPVSSWQAWGGRAGTLIYYKNGHLDHAVGEGEEK